MQVTSVNVGRSRAVVVGARRVASAIGKHAVTGRVAVRPLGLAGDEQADLSVHGGLAKALYASDAVAETPDEGTLHGADAIAGWLVKFGEAFPDAKYEQVNGFEIGDTAVDEGFFTGTNTGSLPMPGGESIPPTGRAIRIRACDLATVNDGAMRRTTWRRATTGNRA